MAARQPALEGRDLGELPLVGAGEEVAPPAVESDLGQHEFKPRYLLRSDSISIASVRALVPGLGLAIIPALAVDLLDVRLAAIPLEG